MKRMNFIMTVMASLMMLAGCEKDDRNVALSSLPQKAQTFVDKDIFPLNILIIDEVLLRFSLNCPGNAVTDRRAQFQYRLCY